jgi:hypothetical protein
MNAILETILGKNFDIKNIPDEARQQLINVLQVAIDEVEEAGKPDIERRVEELEAKLAKAESVIEAATFCNWCPNAGGYSGGRSVEDCYENLNTALSEYYGVHTLACPMDEWITENELRADLNIPLQPEY